MALYDFLVLIISLAVLVIGAELLVKGASKLAKHFGISDFVIGLTLIAIGTSLPELATSISASIAKDSGLIIGNIVGSNIANIGLILGVAVLLYTIKAKDKAFIRDSWFLFWVSILFIIFIFNKVISFTEGLIFLLIFFFYLLHLFKSKEEKIIPYQKLAKHIHLRGDFIKNISFTLFGIIGLYFGAKFLIPAAENLARAVGVGTEIVGLTLIAVGTSLPELFVTISAARRHLEGIFIGNLIGSNIANILLILGISSLINPIQISNSILYLFVPIMMILTILLLKFIKNNFAYRILQGFALLFFYAIFILILFLIRF